VLWMPTRGDGLDEAAVWLSAGLVYLVAAAWLVQGGSVWILLGPIGAGAVFQVWTGWWAWFGVGGAGSPMVGTFYWHNQFGAFVLAVCVTAAGIVVHGQGLRRGLLLGSATIAAVAGAGTVFSGSRACVSLLVASLVLLAITCIRVPRRLLLLGAITGAIWVFAWLLTRLLPASAGAAEALASRGQSAGGNASARLDYAAAAWRIMTAEPWTGSGADSFGSVGPALAGPFAAPTQWVHNGYLQAFVDAGWLFGMAVTASVLGVLAVGVGRLITQERLLRREQLLDPVRTGALLGAGVLAGHAAFDFDWAYPTLTALFAVLSALVLVPGPQTHAAPAGRSRRGATRVRGAVIGAAVGLTLLASAGLDAAAATGGTVPVWRSAVTAGWANGDLPSWLTPASQCRQELQGLVEAGEPVDAATSESLSGCLSRLAPIDGLVAADLEALESLALPQRG
jgi:O-Antigen ligase